MVIGKVQGMRGSIDKLLEEMGKGDWEEMRFFEVDVVLGEEGFEVRV